MIKIEFHDDREPALDETTLNLLQTYTETAISYSTSEIEIGTYKGEKLYRRIIEATTISGYNHISLSSITNLKDVKFMYGMTKQYNSNNKMNLYFYNSSSDMCRAYYEATSNEIVVHCGNDYGFGDVEITIEYTKTS